MLNGETFRVLIKNSKKTRMPAITVTIKHYTGQFTLCNDTRKRYELEGIEKTNYCFIIVYLENSRISIYRFLALIREFNWDARYKNKIQNQEYLYGSANNQYENVIRKNN